jgi:hypothetical protein
MNVPAAIESETLTLKGLLLPVKRQKTPRCGGVSSGFLAQINAWMNFPYLGWI